MGGWVGGWGVGAGVGGCSQAWWGVKKYVAFQYE